MKNILNNLQTNSDKMKSKLKNLTASLALLGALSGTACSNNEKPQTADKTIKTEQVINTKQDTLTSAEKSQSNGTEKAEDVVIDEEMQKYIEQMASETEQELQQPKWKQLGFESENGYKEGLQTLKEMEKGVASYLDVPEAFWDDPEGIPNAEGVIADYKYVADQLQEPYSQTVQKVIKLVKEKKKARGK